MEIDFAWYVITILWILGSLLMFITNDFILNIDKRTGIYGVSESELVDKFISVGMALFWPIVMIIYLIFAALSAPKKKKG